MLSAMYQERLLAEYRAPHNRRELVDATARAERKNPVCGDAVSVMVRVEAGVVQEATFKGQGCSIAVASASNGSPARSTTAVFVRDPRDVRVGRSRTRAEWQRSRHRTAIPC